MNADGLEHVGEEFFRNFNFPPYDDTPTAPATSSPFPISSENASIPAEDVAIGLSATNTENSLDALRGDLPSFVPESVVDQEAFYRYNGLDYNTILNERFTLSSSNLPKPRKPPAIPSEMKPLKNAVLGIHFGLETVRSGVIADGKFYLIPDQENRTAWPNCVLFTDKTVLIGEEAVNRSENGRPSFPLKSVLFDNVGRKFVTEFRGRCVNIRLEDLVALVMEKIKFCAQIFIGNKTIQKCVIVVPSMLDHEQRQSIIDGATIAGFSEPTVITELSAMAVNFHSKCSQNDPLLSKTIFAIYRNDVSSYDAAVFRVEKHLIRMESISGLPCMHEYRRRGRSSEFLDNTLEYAKNNCELDYSGLEITVTAGDSFEAGWADQIPESYHVQHETNISFVESVVQGASKLAHLLSDFMLQKVQISEMLPYEILLFAERSSRRPTPKQFRNLDKFRVYGNKASDSSGYLKIAKLYEGNHFIMGKYNMSGMRCVDYIRCKPCWIIEVDDNGRVEVKAELVYPDMECDILNVQTTSENLTTQAYHICRSNVIEFLTYDRVTSRLQEMRENGCIRSLCPLVDELFLDVVYRAMRNP